MPVLELAESDKQSAFNATRTAPNERYGPVLAYDPAGIAARRRYSPPPLVENLTATGLTSASTSLEIRLVERMRKVFGYIVP